MTAVQQQSVELGMWCHFLHDERRGCHRLAIASITAHTSTVRTERSGQHALTVLVRAAFALSALARLNF